jgi:four helix bundle protein
MFSFQRLDVYKAAIQFLNISVSTARLVPPGNGDLLDQLRRAALSVPLNIAEGTGRFGRDAVRFYTIARGSALESAAILDALEALGLVDTPALEGGREMLDRVVAMLTVMTRR